MRAKIDRGFAAALHLIGQFAQWYSFGIESVISFLPWIVIGFRLYHAIVVSEALTNLFVYSIHSRQ